MDGGKRERVEGKREWMGIRGSGWGTRGSEVGGGMREGG